jgi:transcription elongation factor Elf1
VLQLIILKLNCGHCGLKTEHVSLGVSPSGEEVFKCLRCGLEKSNVEFVGSREEQNFDLPADDSIPCGVA